MALSMNQKVKKDKKAISDELYYKVEERVNARKLILKKNAHSGKEPEKCKILS